MILQTGTSGLAVGLILAWTAAAFGATCTKQQHWRGIVQPKATINTSACLGSVASCAWGADFST